MRDKSLSKNKMSEFTIKEVMTFNDNSEVSELENYGANSDELFLIGFQVDVIVLVKNKNDENKKFNISFQNEERSNCLMSYNNFGVVTSSEFGNDADESCELYNFLESTDENGLYQKIMNACEEKAEKEAISEYERLIFDKKYESFTL